MIKVPDSPLVSNSMDVRCGSGGRDTGVSHPEFTKNNAAMAMVHCTELLLVNLLPMVGN